MDEKDDLAEQIYLLRHTKDQVEQLRRRNEVLSAQVAIVEVFAAALGLRQPNQGVEVDIAWELQRRIDYLKMRAEGEQAK